MVRNWIAFRTILKSDCHLRGARTIPHGRAEWNLMVKDERSLSKLMSRLKMADCQVKIINEITIKNPFALTQRQDTVTKAALEKGYYDLPGRVTGKELAERLNICPSTLSEALQRCERRLVDFYFNFRI